MIAVCQLFPYQAVSCWARTIQDCPQYTQDPGIEEGTATKRNITQRLCHKT